MSDFEDKSREQDPPDFVRRIPMRNWFMAERVRTVMAASLWQEIWINLLLVGLILGFGYCLFWIAGVL